MKIEKINDNQIRCTLNRQDLMSRELKISELAYGTEKAKDLFHDMIEEADKEFGFSVDDMPLMIEAIPVSIDCIVLVITKVDDPEELDTRFSRFAPGDEEDERPDGAVREALDRLFGDDDGIEGLDGTNVNLFANALQDVVEKFATTTGVSLSEMIQDVAGGSDTEAADIDELTAGEDADEAVDSSEEEGIEEIQNEQNGEALPQSDEAVGTSEAELEKPAESVDPAELTRIFAFPSFDAAAHAASHIDVTFTGESEFYKDEQQGIYYLTVTGTAEDIFHFYAVSNSLTEYAHRGRLSYATKGYLSEHCRRLIRKDALKVLCEY